MDIAIIGMAGRFPQANNLDEFYEILRTGKDCIREVSARRKHATLIDSVKEYLPCSYLDDIDKFDYSFFDIPLGEAKYIDPHQRILLEVVYEAIENAGYNVDYFSKSNTALLIGDTYQQYYQLARDFNPLLITGNINSATAGRIARFFNLQGLATMIDTACSSSLVATHLACNCIKLGEADHAIVCGINLNLFPEEKYSDRQIGNVAPDGKAKSFSAAADGTGSGEAAGCILLKPLEKALADSDLIHAIIKGSAVNQDAQRSGSLTAPSSKAQAEVLKKAWDKAGIAPDTISSIEAHGTGTRLGDPIEIEAINNAFGQFTKKKQFCAVSTVKTNIGHADSAAGITGLIKTVLSLKHKELFPSLHFDEPNPFINFSDSALYVNTRLTPWETENGQARRAGVSSFGISGTNCHVLLEEAPIPREQSHARTDLITHYPILISAKTAEGLASVAKSLQCYLSTQPLISLPDLSYTLSVGRKHYPYRGSVIGQSLPEIVQQLPAAAVNVGGIDHIWLAASGDVRITETHLRTFSNQYPAFRNAYEHCLNLTTNVSWHDDVLRFVFQYCFFTLLNSFGFSSKRMIGNGVGKLLIDVVQRKLTLASAIEKISTGSYENNNTTIRHRLTDFVNSRLADGRCAVVELGPEGEITKILQESGQPTTYTVHSLTAENDSCNFLTLLMSLFRAGADIEWSALYEKSACRRIELPTYPFKKTKCWLGSDPGDKSIYNWFYQLQWEPNESLDPTLPTGKVYLLVMDQSGLGRALSRALTKQGNRCIELQLSSAFSEQPEDVFTIDCASPQEYTRFVRTLQSRKIVLHGIFFLNQFSSEDAVSTGDLEGGLRRGAYAEFLLTKALYNTLKNKDFRLIQVLSGAHQVTNEIVAPEKQASFGLFKALLSEITELKVRSIDIPHFNAEQEAVVGLLIKETFAENPYPFAAYRDGTRYVQRLKRIMQVDDVNDKINLRTGGVYMITGGTSGIGLEVAKLIASRVQCKLILVGRTQLPPRATWNAIARRKPTNSISKKIIDLTALEELGSEVTYYQVALEDQLGLSMVFDEIRRQHGSLNGIFHAAGLSGERTSLDRLSFESFQLVLHPKIQGTYFLDKLSAGMHLDHFVLFSSLNTVIPQANTVDYTVANAFEDAYASRLAFTRGRKAYAINWGAWGQTGAGGRVDVRSQENLNAPLRAWSTEDGLLAFELALNIGAPNVIVGDMDTRFLQFPFFKFERSQDSFASSTITFAAGSDNRDDQLLSIWCTILGRNDIGTNDNFFKLGGHSLLGAQLINRIEKQFGLSIAFRDLLSFPTVTLLAGYLNKIQQTNSTTYEAITPAHIQNSYDLSAAQRRVWIANQVNKHSSTYNLYSPFRFIGELNRVAFERAFAELVKRHESLRTNFILEKGEPRQKISDATVKPFVLSYLDLSGDPEAEQKAQVLALDEADKVFDLESDQLIRAKLIRVAGDEYVFFFTIHHIISDGWSIGIIIKEVLTLYQAFDQGHTNPLPPLRIQYKDYAVWQAKQLVQFEKHQQYWAETLQSFGGIVPLDLPIDRVRPTTPTYKGATVNFLIDPQLTTQIRKLSERHDATIFISIVTAFKILFYKYTGQTDIAIGSVVAGRNHPDLEDQIGFFLNMLVLRTRFTEEDTGDEVLEKIKETTLSAYEHQSYPFEKLAEDVTIDREVGRQPLFDVVINLLNFNSTKFSALNERLRISPYPIETKESKFDLTIYVSEDHNGLQIALEYNTDIFDHRTIELMAKRFRITLNSLVGHPGEKIRNLVWKEAMRLPSIVAVER
jgi:acyl transferase domain-containing protein/acyl carrier protein